MAAESLVQLLHQRRGWDQGALARINDPSHPELRDMDAMVTALKQIHDSGEQLVVMPDYDMDGITAGTLGYAGLRELGFEAALYVPDYRDGHDIIPAAVDKLKASFPQARAVITCDAGINSHAGIQRGKDHGMTMLVTDHHTQEAGPVVPADVAVNPCRLDEDYPNKGICGAFVMWQVLDAYARRHRPDKVRAIALLRLFAGVGTVSDVMPLVYENRALVRDSIAIARTLHVPLPSADTVTPYDPEASLMMTILRAEPHDPAYLSAFLGFAVLLKAFREHGKLEQELDENGNGIVDDQGEPVMVRKRGPLREFADLSEEFYGFYLAPTFNAVRRTGAPMSDAFGVFIAEGADHKYEHAVALIENNVVRREKALEYRTELDESLEDGRQPLAPYVWFTHAPSGMLGLLANSLMQELGHPVAVLADRPRPSGSMRAPGWFDIISTLGDRHGIDVQGHQQACGVHLPDRRAAAHLSVVLSDEVDAMLARATAAGLALDHDEPDLRIGDHPEADADFDQYDELVELGTAIEALGPFGQGFPAPEMELVLDLSQCRIQAIGATEDHLRITTPRGLKVYWWSAAEDHMGELLDISHGHDPVVRLRARLRINEYMGYLSPQFIVDRMVQR